MQQRRIGIDWVRTRCVTRMQDDLAKAGYYENHGAFDFDTGWDKLRLVGAREAFKFALKNGEDVGKSVDYWGQVMIVVSTCHREVHQAPDTSLSRVEVGSFEGEPLLRVGQEPWQQRRGKVAGNDHGGIAINQCCQLPGSRWLLSCKWDSAEREDGHDEALNIPLRFLCFCQFFRTCNQVRCCHRGETKPQFKG